MNWINIYTPLLRSGPFAEATDAQLGAWTRLNAFCAEQENGGQIHGSFEWSERKWMTTAGVSKAILNDASPLWHFSQIGSLVLHSYNLAKEQEIRAKRVAAKRTNAQRWGKKSKRKNRSATRSVSRSVSREGEVEVEVEDKLARIVAMPNGTKSR